MFFNTTRTRGPLETLDYTDEDETSPALTLLKPARSAPLVLPRGAPLVLPEIKLWARGSRLARSRVPRLSTLVRFEQEHQRRLEHVRRRFVGIAIAALLIGFVCGATLGAQRQVVVEKTMSLFRH